MSLRIFTIGFTGTIRYNISRSQINSKRNVFIDFRFNICAERETLITCTGSQTFLIHITAGEHIVYIICSTGNTQAIILYHSCTIKFILPIQQT